MLANGATLGYKANGSTGSTFTKLLGLKEIPENGVEPEKVENTDLDATNKEYEFGIGDPGEMQYKFKYDNSSADSPYRVLRGYQANNTLLDFEETLNDGTKTSYSAYVSVKRTGGGVNGVIEFTLNMAVSGKITYTDPA